MIETIKKDITDPEIHDSVNIVIAHVCNNLGGFGAGVAKAIGERWP